MFLACIPFKFGKYFSMNAAELFIVGSQNERQNSVVIIGVVRDIRQ
jgi:hypothetical protein